MPRKPAYDPYSKEEIEAGTAFLTTVRGNWRIDFKKNVTPFKGKGFISIFPVTWLGRPRFVAMSIAHTPDGLDYDWMVEVTRTDLQNYKIRHSYVFRTKGLKRVSCKYLRELMHKLTEFC